MRLIETFCLLFLSISPLAYTQIPATYERYETYPAAPPSPLSEINAEFIYSPDKSKKGLKIKNIIVLETVYDDINIVYSYPQKFLEIKRDNKVGISDMNGQILIPADFKEIEKKELNIFIAKKDKNISVFDLDKKKTILSGNYKNIISYNFNSALLEDNSNNQFIVFGDGKKIKNDFQSVDFYNNVIVVQKNNKFGILDSKNSPSYEYDQLTFSKTKGVKSGNSTKYNIAIKDFVATKNNLYGIVDITGKIKLPFDYSNISFDSKFSAFKLERGNKLGYYFDENKMLKAEYSSIYRDASSDYLTLEKDRKYGIVNYNTLKEVVPFISDESMIRYHGGYKIRQNQKYGWYNKDGVEILPPVYDQINDFYDSDFLLGIQKDGKKGLYNIQQRKILVPTEYDEITDYYNGFLVGLTENKNNQEIVSREFTLMDLSGKKILDETFSYFDKSPQKKSKIIFAKKNGTFSILTSKGSISVENISAYNYIYDQVNLIDPDASNHNALMSLKNTQNKFAIYDEIQEKLKSDFIYDDIKQKFENEQTFLIVAKNKKYGIINQDNKIILDFFYDDLSFNLINDYKNPTVVAKKNGKYGLLDFSGKTVIPFNYSYMERISGDLFKAKIGKNYILINSDNKVLNNGPFDEISNFENGKALTFYTQKVKEIDSKGNFTGFEDNFSPHIGFKTFDEMKFGFVKMLSSTKDEDVLDYAKKLAPSPHLLYYLKQSSFKNKMQYINYESVVENYYQELLDFKKSYRNSDNARKTLTDKKDFTVYGEYSITSYRNGIQDYGASIAEKYLRNSFKINGFWISSHFLYNY